jgi:flagellar hook-associated protein 2
MSTVQNTTRITGLFSGIDTDALVKAMTMGQQRNVDMLAASRTRAEWKRDQITDFNNKLRVFRETYGSVIGSGSLLSRGSFTSFSVKMGDNTGVSVSASATAKAGSYSVRVDQIASAAALKGNKLTARSTGLTAAEINSTSIGRLSEVLTGGGSVSGAIEFSINGRAFSFSSDASLKNIMDEVNRANIGVTMAYSQTTDSVTVTSSMLGAYEPPSSSEFATEAEFAAALEAYNGANERKNISFTDDTGFLAYLGMTEVTAGQNALVYINGEQEARSLDTNSITLDGVSMSFLRPTGESGVDFTLQPDYQPAISRIKNMVEAYNTLIKELDTAHNQKPNRDFPPLTDEQRGEMNDKEIENWEAKAKEGLLARDNVLGRLINGMRSILGGSFGSGGTLASIGITTGRYMVGEPVQLQVDDEKLLAALQEDPDRVYDMFSAPESAGSRGGLMTQLNKVMDEYVNTTRGRELQNLNNDINTYSKRIKEQTDKLAVMGEQYYLQYARLETMLGKMMSQQDSMAMMFGWGNQ